VIQKGADVGNVSKSKEFDGNKAIGYAVKMYVNGNEEEGYTGAARWGFLHGKCKAELVRKNGVTTVTSYKVTWDPQFGGRVSEGVDQLQPDEIDRLKELLDETLSS
jgi:hypothetical protein